MFADNILLREKARVASASTKVNHCTTSTTTTTSNIFNRTFTTKYLASVPRCNRAMLALACTR